MAGEHDTHNSNLDHQGSSVADSPDPELELPQPLTGEDSAEETSPSLDGSEGSGESSPRKSKGLHVGWSILLVLIGAVVPYFFVGGANSVDQVADHARKDGVVSMSWQDLRSYDYRRDILPDRVREKITQRVVQLPGFAVPLQMGEELDHFLLVPTQAYCIHVPPPPPHLMVEVRMKKKQSLRMGTLRRPLLITGQLRLQQRETSYGHASWYFVGDSMEIYQP